MRIASKTNLYNNELHSLMDKLWKKLSVRF